MFENQIQQAHQIITEFERVFWITMFALTQSGKTGCYLFVSFEMFRRNKVKQLILMCGDSSIDLKSQLQQDLNCHLFGKCLQNHTHCHYSYLQYLDKTLGRNKEHLLLCKTIKNNCFVLFSNDLMGFHKSVQNTLIVWDESHYAQDKHNRPAEFFKKHHINCNGDPEYLSPRKIYVLSVSATPFSESSDITWISSQSEWKKMFYFKPDSGYIGVKEFYENSCIYGFKDWRKRLMEVLALEYDYDGDDSRKTYAIIRTTDEHYMKILARKYGWKLVLFDSKNRDKITTISDLKTAPLENTLIIIKGFLRMGKVIPKEHISFVMDTSKSNSDTVLQSLLGRMCGYDSNLNIRIFIEETFLKDYRDSSISEIKRFINFSSGGDFMPLRGRNLSHKRKKEEDTIYHDTIPYRICVYKGSEEDDSNSDDYMPHKAAIKEAFKKGNVQNCNSDAVYDDIKKQVENIDDADLKIMNPKVFRDCPERLLTLIKNRDSSGNYGSKSCGFDKPNQIIAWFFADNFFNSIGIKKGEMIVCFRTQIDESITETSKRPKTTLDEVFSGLSSVSKAVLSENSTTSILPSEFISSEVMKVCLENQIELTMRNKTLKRIFKADGSGLKVSETILKSLSKGGEIYDDFWRRYNVQIKVKKMYYKPVGFPSGFVRLSQISW